jgi:hypothetical protein
VRRGRRRVDVEERELEAEEAVQVQVDAARALPKHDWAMSDRTNSAELRGMRQRWRWSGGSDDGGTSRRMWEKDGLPSKDFKRAEERQHRQEQTIRWMNDRAGGQGTGETNQGIYETEAFNWERRVFCTWPAMQTSTTTTTATAATATTACTCSCKRVPKEFQYSTRTSQLQH